MRVKEGGWSEQKRVNNYERISDNKEKKNELTMRKKRRM
jgi:hypothetical protein